MENGLGRVDNRKSGERPGMSLGLLPPGGGKRKLETYKVDASALFSCI